MRRILVTGGGSGIGRMIAQDFARAGDAVTIAGRRMDALKETAQGFDMTTRRADVTKEADVTALFDAPYDVVVANAGVGAGKPFRDVTLDEWTAQIDVNLTGTFLVFREALRAGMGEGGRLIAVASTASLMGQSGIAAYASAKHGVLGLVRSVAQEVAREGITCNAVCPYYVDTPLTEQGAQRVAEARGISIEESRAMLAKRNPIGRLIAPEEVSSAVLYLASPGAAMVNGHALSISGGMI
jgi:NAD(P)-dependent dehydrogenase (short-subunit alcohol dehydrogenase family)